MAFSPLTMSIQWKGEQEKIFRKKILSEWLGEFGKAKKTSVIKQLMKVQDCYGRRGRSIEKPDSLQSGLITLTGTILDGVVE